MKKNDMKEPKLNSNLVRLSDRAVLRTWSVLDKDSHMMVRIMVGHELITIRECDVDTLIKNLIPYSSKVLEAEAQ